MYHDDSSTGSKAKGLLFYGPPGSGKSFLCDNLIDSLGLEVIFSGNSA
jgi:ATP-dependent 26S proteasome regulatory subunit